MENKTSELPKNSLEELLEQFSKGTPRKRRSLINSVEERVQELCELGPVVLDEFDPSGQDWSAGWILQVIQGNRPEELPRFLSDSPNGWFETPSENSIDYEPLQDNLLNQSFEEADRLTSSILRTLAGVGAVERGYVYFSEVSGISGIDLTTLDRLWTAYSQGRFGFTAQAKLLQSLGGRYDKLWPRIGWKIEGVWTRYPKAFTWSIKAPEGHMPLINQLRGVRLMDAVLNHPALVKRR